VSFLADVNVLVDLALDRHPWSADATRLFDEAVARGVPVFVSAITVPTLFYLTRRAADIASAFNVVDRVLRTTEVVDVGAGILAAARAMPGSDFEENFKIASAVSANVELIVTRDLVDFAHSPIRAVSPAQLLQEFLTQP
jgi:predicted nucleic acid-binding protein